MNHYEKNFPFYLYFASKDNEIFFKNWFLDIAFMCKQLIVYVFFYNIKYIIILIIHRSTKFVICKKNFGFETLTPYKKLATRFKAYQLKGI